ncbi:CBS domain-containing protein [Candidatus Woesearchaeota archaeon]|nr:CBS domain-containing protein [Candidatus Woesearchaeota archaeon]
MISELREIQEFRKKHGLTQTELAKLAGVSQSLIAKIESNKIDPTYTNIKKIFSAIECLNQKKEIKASEIINKNIISVKAEDSLKHTIKIMKQKGISQVPVIDQKHPDLFIGMISEAKILDAIMNNASPDSKVREFMGECPPIISKDSTITLVGSLLKYSPMVIVKDKGKTIGIITKADLLGRVYQ